MKTGILIALLSSNLLATTYKATNNNTIIRVDDNTFIPINPENRDYKAFLLWQKPVIDGGEAGIILPADPLPTAQEMLAALRAAAINLESDDPSPQGKALRGIILVLIDELNRFAQRDRDRAVDVAAATSLADLKTRWAARPTLNDRDISQVKPAIGQKISSGSSD